MKFCYNSNDEKVVLQISTIITIEGSIHLPEGGICWLSDSPSTLFVVKECEQQGEKTIVFLEAVSIGV